MVNKVVKSISGKFSIIVGILAVVLLSAGYFITRSGPVFALSNIFDTFSDTSKINTGTSTNYRVSNGSLKINYNTGDDGAITISSTKNINTDILSDRSYADGVKYAVSAIGTNTVTVSGTPNGIAANDEILLINLQGTSSDYGNVGKYEFLRVSGSPSGSVITFTGNIANSYGDPATQKIMVQRVPNYTTVNIQSGGVLTASAWDGSTGGIVAFRANSTVTVTGAVTAGSGYRGSATPTGGESFCGINSGACGGGHGASPPGSNGCNAGQAGSSTGGAGGGSGCGGEHDTEGVYFIGGTGGGGGYGGWGYGGTTGFGGTTNGVNGGDGVSGAGGEACKSGNKSAGAESVGGGGGGGTYGTANLSTLYFGSGGGGGGGGECGSTSGVAGAGIIFIHASTLTVTGSITSNGQAVGGFGGSGAGGSILLYGGALSLSSGITATGGSGSASGGNGRIAAGGSSVGGTETSPAHEPVTAPTPTATVYSTNLLSGQTVTAISSFVYNLSLKPTGSTATIVFSQNGTDWYNSQNQAVPSATADTLTTGANNSIDLSGLNWSGANFYYKIVLTGSVSPILNDIRVNYKTHLEPPTIGDPSDVTTTSIRWNFTDNSTDETGFKLYDENNVLKFTCATANISSCVEDTGLTPGVSYTRKVAAYDGGGIGGYSSTKTVSTLSVTPLAPTVTSGTATTVNINPNPAAGAVGTDVYAIYRETDGTCDGSGGSYIAADGSGTGSAVWQLDSAWGTVVATGLNLEQNTYSICVKSKNVSELETPFGPADSGNGGFIPLSGYSTLGNAVQNKYRDGNNTDRYVYGVDNGTSTSANTAVFNVSSGTTTVLSTDTVVFGSLTLTGGTLVIQDGAVLKPGSKLWVVDADNDNIPRKISAIPNDVPLYFADSAPANGRRRTAIPTMNISAPDCNDGSASVWVPHTACYTDVDGDTYTTTQNSNTTCLNTSSCATATYAGLAGDGNGVSSYTQGRLLNAANGSDCNDNDNSVSLTVNPAGYLDADGDGYGAGNSTTCAPPGGSYVANNTDCGSNSNKAYPDSTYCETTPYTNVASVLSYDYNCKLANGTYNYDGSTDGQEFCGTAYDRWESGLPQYCMVPSGSKCKTCATYANNHYAITQVCGQQAGTCTGWNYGGCFCGCEGDPGTHCISVSVGTQGCQ